MVISLIVPVSAQEKAKIKREEMKETFIDMDIDERTAEVLVLKLEKGEELDSFKKEYKNIEPYETIEDDFGIIEKFAYPDGSKKIVTIGKTPYGIFTGKITGGNKASGNGWYDWKGAKVSATWGVVTASFYADFQGAKDLGKITRAYTPSVTIVGGTFRSEKLSITRSVATSSSPATAQLYFIGEGMSGIGASTVYLTLRVPMNGNPTAQMQI